MSSSKNIRRLKKKNKAATNREPIDTTTIPGIRKAGDMLLRLIVDGEIDSRSVGAANGTITNQIRLLQHENVVEELDRTRKLLHENQTKYAELMCAIGEQDLWFFSELMEMLPQQLADNINDFLEGEGEKIACKHPEINTSAIKVIFGKETEQWVEAVKAKMSPEQLALWKPIPLPTPNVATALFYMRREWAHKYQYPTI